MGKLKDKETIGFLIWGISVIILSLFYISKQIHYENSMIFFNLRLIFIMSISLILGIKLTFRGINLKKHTHIIRVIISFIFFIFIMLFSLILFPSNYMIHIALPICSPIWCLICIEIILTIENKYPLSLEIVFNSVFTILFIFFDIVLSNRLIY